jgi:hypothetical protein
VRVHQFQKDPPVVRIVVQLLHLDGYSWDEAGNRLMIRLRPAAQDQKAAPVAGHIASAEKQGSVVLASSRSVMDSPLIGSLAMGSPVRDASISAGIDPAVLHLARGGEVRVCPGTTVAVTASRSGRDVMLGMSTGALETHYLLQSAADSVMTPDFRIVPTGSGEFDYAISADSRGNTCLRSLPGNTATAVVSELMGDGVYQVKPSEQVIFHHGRLAAPDAGAPADCGCSPGAIPVLRSSAVTPEAAPRNLAAPDGIAPPPEDGVIASSSASAETTALPPSNPSDVHVQIDAPFVFRAADAPPAQAQTSQAENLPPSSPQGPNLLDITVLPPGAPPKAPAPAPQPPGFLGKLKNFFAGIFR